MAVYDTDEDLRKPASTPDEDELRRITGIDPDEEAGMEEAASKGAAQDIDEASKRRMRGFGKKRVSDSPERLREQEESDEESSPSKAETGEADELDNSAGEFKWRPGRKKRRSRISRLSSTKQKLILGAGLGSAIIMIILFLFILMALRIPHFMQNVTEWQFQRSARIFRQSAQALTEERLTMDAADSAVRQSHFQELRSRWGSFKSDLMEPINRYRPNKILQNLKTTGRLEYIYEETGKQSIWSGKESIFKGIKLDGEEIPYGSEKFRSLFGNRSNRLSFNATLDANLERALENSNTLVRSKVGNLIMEENSLKRFFWSKAGSEYRGLRNDAADNLLARDSFRAVHTDAADGCLVPSTCSTAKAANEAIEKQLDDNVANSTDNAVEAGAVQATAEREARVSTVSGVSDDVVKQALKDSLGSAAKFNAIVGSVSTINQFAMPFCIVLEGSIQHSSKFMQSKQASTTKEFITAATISDQIKDGKKVNATAQGAAARKFDNVGNTNAQLRASGQVPDTRATMASVVTPETSPQGEFNDHSMSILGENQGINDFAESTCHFLLDPRVAIGVAVAELVAGFATFGSSAGAEAGLHEAVNAGVSAAFKRLGEQFAEVGIKGIATGAAKGIGKTATRIGVEVGATSAVTLLARANLYAAMNAYVNGLSTGIDYNNQVDMGADWVANRTVQPMFYARPLTPEEEVEDYKRTTGDLSDKQKLDSPFNRYFAISNANSLISRFGFSMLGKINGGPTKAFTNILSSGGSILNPSRLVPNLFSQKVKAANTIATGSLHYNITQFGWTDSEMALSETDEYMPINNSEFMARATIKNGDGKDEPALDYIDKKFGKCFTGDMTDLLADKDIKKDDDGHVIANQGLCSPVNLGPNNPDYGDLVYRYRLVKMRQNTLDHLLSIQDPQESEESSGNTNGGPVELGVIRGKTSDVQCSAGGPGEVVTGYSGGRAYEIRICNVQGIKVNSQISAQVNKLLSDASRSGINLVNGSGAFRTMEAQIALRKANGCPDVYNASPKSCRTQTARPGFSNHQMGFAIDFNCNGSLIVSVTNACYRWLQQYASSYGLYVLSSGGEPWHWSVNGN